MYESTLLDYWACGSAQSLLIEKSCAVPMQEGQVPALLIINPAGVRLTS